LLAKCSLPILSFFSLSRRTPHCLVEYAVGPRASDSESEKKISPVKSTRFAAEASKTMLFAFEKTPLRSLPPDANVSFMRALSDTSLHNTTPETQPKGLRPAFKRRR
jgi:hypothetical protein